MNKNYYDILGVPKSANGDEIKKAFHKLAHQYHPDKAGGNEEKFKEINEAYQVLSNKEKRSQYDQYGQTFSGAGSQGGGFNGFGGFQNGQGYNVNFEDLGDIFGSFGDMFGFGGHGQRSSQTARGSDLEMTLEIEFLEAAFGAEKKVKFRKDVACKHCNGSGVEPGAKIDTCPICHGHGRVNKVQKTIFGAMQIQSVCDACGGKGKKASQNCTICRGSGVNKENVELNIKIPAGINNGETIKYSGQGEAGKNGSAAGDLYIHFRIKPDKRWERNGYDLKSKLEISFSEATLGAKKIVETIYGQETIKIAEGTQPNLVINLKGKGIERLKGSGKGDHLVEIIVKVPNSLNRSQKKAIEELQSIGL